jgi:hypothetical protein
LEGHCVVLKENEERENKDDDGIAELRITNEKSASCSEAEVQEEIHDQKPHKIALFPVPSR